MTIKELVKKLSDINELYDKYELKAFVTEMGLCIGGEYGVIKVSAALRDPDWDWATGDMLEIKNLLEELQADMDVELGYWS